jgi:hypothetical protein
MKNQTGIGRRDLVDIKMRRRGEEKLSREPNKHKHNKTAEII